MAERRMFNKTLMSSNLFTELNKSAQLLYMYLNLQADDDGICGNTKAICRMCGCGKTHLQALIDSGWLLPFEQGEVAIAHWHIHNQIRKDRYKPSIYTHVKEQLQKGKDGVYVVGCQNCAIAATQESKEQESTAQDSINQDSIAQDSQGKTIPAEPVASSSEPPGAADDHDIEIEYDKILYNYQCICKNLAPCNELTPLMREKIDLCYKAGYNALRLVGVFYNANQSAFLQGENPKGWQASLEWLLNPENARKVAEGKYTTWL